MTNFSINFDNPWLLLLLIPAIGLTLFTYFRLSKKYRKTRNRIISMILHGIVMALSIAVLAGINFTYDLPNTENEILLVVDCSDSEQETQADKNEFVRSAISKLGTEYKIGVVAFGYEPVYAAELTNQTSTVYQQYLDAKVDGTASDVAAALTYAKSLFERPETAKIVLISDGLETDESALAVIKSIAAAGIKVDTKCFTTEQSGKEVQVNGVELPDRNITVGETFSMDVAIQSSYSGKVTLKVYDNSLLRSTQEISVEKGEQTVSVEHSFTLPGFHEVKVELETTDTNDEIAQNNVYYTYKLLATYDKILIIDGGHTDGETTALNALLDDENFTVTVIKANSDAMPTKVKELQSYDEVILMNVANADLPDGFIDILYSYVYEIGGGLLTVGGNTVDENGETIANMYNRKDLSGTLYQDMLPVQAIDYTPPIAVMILIDGSGSMSNLFDTAKEGAISALNSLTERDYCGVMQFSSDNVTAQDILPVSQKWKIVEAIDSMEMLNKGTTYSLAIEKAGQALMAVKNVERRHIIIVSDGAPTESEENYLYFANLYYESAGITISVVLINSSSSSVSSGIDQLVEAAHGRSYNVSADDLSLTMREELKVPEIKEVNYEEFTPTITNYTAIVNGISQKDIPTLSGYYGTKAKDGATVVLSGTYVPVYAEWKYGEGMVGSFMCDLNGTWSSQFLESDTGKQLIVNMLKSIAPTQNIRANEIDAVFTEDNFHTLVSIYTDMEEGQTIQLTISGNTVDGEEVEKIVTTSATEDYSRINFMLDEAGVYTVRIDKLNADGSIAATSSNYYRILSYSAEYNAFASVEDGEALLEKLASVGNGNVVTDVWSLLENIEHEIHKEYDPVIPFMIIAIVLFLLDIAVRKFKFKWIHEMVRESREKKETANGGVKGK
jgi:uncharacterized membrane protein/Mg-chelatase subunit ChlD